MLEHPTRTLEKGDHVTLTLVFRTAGTVSVTVPVTGYPVDGALPSDALTPVPSAAAS
jgi:copper(I)-binding protein